MSNYRPICDIWLLARPKVSYYGSFPAGFLGRARDLLGVGSSSSVLHVCSGMVKDYPFRGLGANDFTMDLDPELDPDFCQDVREPWPTRPEVGGWDAILCDPPYSEDDANHYACGGKVYPEPAQLLKRAWEALRPGGKVGILHYQVPRPPSDAHFVACVGVVMGFGNRIRAFSVFQKPVAP